METMRSSRTFCLRRTHESGFERGLFTFHVSPFHRRRSRFFWAFVVVVGFCLVLCFLTISRSHQSYQCYALNDRLSCHGAHGMGEKKDKKYFGC